MEQGDWQTDLLSCFAGGSETSGLGGLVISEKESNSSFIDFKYDGGEESMAFAVILVNDSNVVFRFRMIMSLPSPITISTHCFLWSHNQTVIHIRIVFINRGFENVFVSLDVDHISRKNLVASVFRHSVLAFESYR